MQRLIGCRCAISDLELVFDFEFAKIIGPGSCSVGVHHHLTTVENHEVVEARRHPRYKMEVDIRIYPRNTSVLRGHTVDISESGISAMVRQEVPVGEVVRLEFALPLGNVEVLALVRQRNAFRFGFQFVDAAPIHDILERTCRQLAVQEALGSHPAE